MGNKEEKIINDFLKYNYILSENKNELYSILVPIIFSKKIFRKGSELQAFLKDELGIEFANYVFKSRTILAGKLTRYINNMSIEDSVTLNRLVIEKISTIIKESTADDTNTDLNIKEANRSLFSLWTDQIENKE